jgi:hypothetical protein
VILLAGTAAKANTIDFFCNPTAPEQCSGSVVKSGATYTATNLHVFEDTGLYTETVPFDLSFTFNSTTDTGTISIDGTGSYAGTPKQDFSGDITSGGVLVGGSSTEISLFVNWTVLPLAAQEYLGDTSGSGTAGIGLVSLREHSTDVSIVTPEPASFMLLGTGLLAVVGVLRRKQRKQA